MKIFVKYSYWILALVMLLICLALDLPAPYRDDLLFIGPAIHKALYGSNANVFCEGFLQQFATSMPYYYLPGQFIVLQGYMGAMGVSWVVLAVYILGQYVVGGYFLWLLLKKIGISLAGNVCSLAFYWMLLLQIGLRPEALGYTLLYMGIYIGWQYAKWRILGLFLIGFSIYTAPMLIAVYAPLALLFFWKVPSKRLWFLGANIIVILLLLVITYVYTQGEMMQFFEVFRAHMQSLQFYHTSKWGILVHEVSTNHQYLFLSLLFVCGLIAGIWGLIKRDIVVLVLLSIAILGLYIYPDRALHLQSKFAVFILVVYVASNYFKLERAKRLAFLGVGLLLVVTHSIFIITQIFQQKRSIIGFDKQQLQHASTIVCDAFAARYVYDYKLPLNVRSLDFYATQFSPKSFDEQRATEVWLYNAVFPYRMRAEEDKQIEKVKIGGIVFQSIVVYPNMIFLREFAP